MEAKEKGERSIERRTGSRVRVVVVINTHAPNRVHAMEGLMKDWMAQASGRGCKSSSGVPVPSANGFSVTRPNFIIRHKSSIPCI